MTQKNAFEITYENLCCYFHANAKENPHKRTHKKQNYRSVFTGFFPPLEGQKAYLDNISVINYSLLVFNFPYRKASID